MSKYKIGDEVVILDGSKIKCYTGGWSSDMNPYVGSRDRIANIDDAYEGGRVGYSLEGNGFIWDERGLSSADNTFSINGIDLDGLVRRVVKDKVEITVNVDPEHMEVSIQPWKPFEYSCPYQSK